jgi:cobalt-zinc-cadmium efflux system protein
MPDLFHGEAEAERTVLRALRLAVEISIVLLAIEAVGAVLSHSLSITVDAVHNIPDIFAFTISWTALRSAARGASDSYTFGTHRVEVFAGLANATLVLGTGLVFGYEALATTLRGIPYAGAVDPVWLLLAAVPTLALRTVAAVVLGRIPGRVRDLNFRSVLLHMVSDVVITVGLLVVAAILLLYPGDAWVDPAVALAIAGVLVVESLPLFRDAGEVLTERIPRHLSVASIERTALTVEGVDAVHDLHVWAVCPTLICMTAHVAVREMSVRESMDVVSRLRDAMARDHGILHAVFEVENLPTT